jgi:hypothetical protein
MKPLTMGHQIILLHLKKKVLVVEQEHKIVEAVQMVLQILVAVVVALLKIQQKLLQVVAEVQVLL